MTTQLTSPATPASDPHPPAAEAFWTHLLSVGGSIVLPRWCDRPVPELAVVEAELPAWLTAGSELPAAQHRLPDSTVAALLTAHATVLSALTGQDEVVIGYRTGEGQVLPLPAELGPQTWAELQADLQASRRGLLQHRDHDLPALAHRLRIALPFGDSVVDLDRIAVHAPTEPSAFQPELPVVQLRVAQRTDRVLMLQLAYRRDCWNQAMADRVLGYHLAALDVLGRTPEHPHRDAVLLSDAEVDLQVSGMAGPERDLPQLRFHQLVEQVAADQPDRLAARDAGTEWTYRELNEASNRVAHRLIAEGVGAEQVVAVVTERTLHWLAAVLGVFKAGAVYLPIEPHFPPGRFEATLSRAGCGLALTEHDSRENLDAAIARLAEPVRTLTVTEVLAEQDRTDNPGLPVGPDQLAYIYFTSGSTGLPKGAMCEHAGMLNHLFAKIDDLGIGPDSVVAQTAPQCFDISLWQLVAALGVGGCTLIVEQEAILDVPRFLQELRDSRVNVVQLVPSYLEVVVSYLEAHPTDLPDLVCVSATGEALKADLVRRWFAVLPQVRLVNAYGLTETSDDTNHEVMTAPPAGDRVPLGPPINNVRIYLLDEQYRPVPLGAPGAIAFSGVCVGRGYINDPDRTAAAYLADPFHPGERMYLAGDYGRWQVDGKLDFLGRRDHQVKINGFRIEIGEIDNTLLLVPGVRDAAVVTPTTPAGGQQLVAFYSADAPLDGADIKARLAQALPGYMVPHQIYHQETLPLTGNGKIDRKALTALAETALQRPSDGLDRPGTGHVAPAGAEPTEAATEALTPTQRRLAEAWGRILGVPVEQLAPTDNFYDRGGSSLLAVKLVIALDRVVSLRDLTTNPVLADQAALLEARTTPAVTGLLQPLTDVAAGRPALICLPYAGGNAVNFVPLARALDGRGVSVFAAELPGHDPAAPGEPFAELTSVVSTLTAEVSALHREHHAPVMVYGHSLGTATVLAVAGQLEQAGVPVARVFLGAQLLGTAQRRQASVDELAGLSDSEITARLSGSGGHPDLADLDAGRANHVGAAFRHDHDQAQQHLLGLLASPARQRLHAPVTVVVAADDPSTADYPTRYHEWELLAERVDLIALPDGGHYFLQTRPEQLAEVIRTAGGPVTDRVAGQAPAPGPVTQ